MKPNCRSVARRLFLVFGSFIIYVVCIGIPLSFGVFYNELSSVFDLGDGEMGWVASLFTGILFGTGKGTTVICLKSNNSIGVAKPK